MSEEMKRVNIRLTPEIHEWFRVRSDKTGVPASSLMFLALEQYVQQQNMIRDYPELLAKVGEPVIKVQPSMLEGLKHP